MAEILKTNRMLRAQLPPRDCLSLCLPRMAAGLFFFERGDLAMKSWFEHRFNPLHIMCRLVELGMDRARARWLSMRYEKWYDKVCYWEVS